MTGFGSGDGTVYFPWVALVPPISANPSIGPYRGGHLAHPGMFDI